jgi:hypothetical protein
MLWKKIFIILSPIIEWGLLFFTLILLWYVVMVQVGIIIKIILMICFLTLFIIPLFTGLLLWNVVNHEEWNRNGLCILMTLHHLLIPGLFFQEIGKRGVRQIIGDISLLENCIAVSFYLECFIWLLVFLSFISEQNRTKASLIHHNIKNGLK